MPTITSAVAGMLTATSPYDDWWTGATLALPYFDGAALPLVFSGERPPDDRLPTEADAALSALLALTSADRLAASQLVFDDMKAFLDAVEHHDDDAPLHALTDPDEIWRFVHPNGLQLEQRHRHDRDWYVAIEGRCDWEQEHGLQLVYRQGCVLTRVGPVDGHLTAADAFDRPDAEDVLLSRFPG